MKEPKLLFLFIISFLIYSCSNDTAPITEKEQETPTSTSPNILLIIADDMGLDATPGYNVGSVKPNMPTLQGIMNSGIKFNNLWAYPVCTPTRGSIITGKYGFRTNVTKVDDPLSTSETSIQKHLDNNAAGYNHAVIGKWHLSKDPNHPTDMGINYYSGNLGGGTQSYWNWNLTQNGQTENSTEYTTTKFTDLAIDWIGAQTQPWFLWLAYNAPHTPFHLPPNNLHYQGNLPSDEASIASNPIQYYMAMIEAMDTEMGRLINSMSAAEKENTVIIFIGDNGTPNKVEQDYGRSRAKGSIYQGGINVPMVVSGKNVSRINDTEDALINTTDLFATIADIAGTGTTEINDSKSFKPLFTNPDANKRDYVYAESNQGNVSYAIRNATHKYIYFEDGTEEFYNLSNDTFEGTNLLDATKLPLSSENSVIKDDLISLVNAIRK